MNNNNVYVEHWLVLGGKRLDHKTVSKVVGIGHKCVYVQNRSHTGTRTIKQEHLIRLVENTHE